MIYLDHNATTPVHPEVLEAMLPLFKGSFGNPSSIHWAGREARKYLDDARETVAEFLKVDPFEIIFTSSGSDSDYLALVGIAEGYSKKGNHIITTSVEHPAVLDTCKLLEKKGRQVTYLPVDGDGLPDLEQLRENITDQTILISVMYANNETGAILPIEEIGKIAAERGILFHSDTVQAVGKIPVKPRQLNLDLISLSGHKIYAPKGVGALFVKRGVKIKAVMPGHQERGRRAGTENVPYIVGLAKACEIARKEMADEAERLKTLRDKLWQGMNEKIEYISLNGHPERRLPGTVNVGFEYVEGEGLLLNLDMEDIAVSSGSACTSGTLEPSHVLMAMGVPADLAQGALRFSLGRANTEADVDKVLSVLPGIVEKLRNMSPLYARMKKEGREAVREALLKAGSSETFKKHREKSLPPG